MGAKEKIDIRYNLGEINNRKEKIFLGAIEKGCVFCGKPYSSDSFRSESHSAPALLNNKKLFNLNECDDCNQHFSQFENDLANYLGGDRSLYSIKGRRKVPFFEISKEQKITYDKKLKIPVIPIDGEHVTFDEKKKEITISYGKDSYSNTGLFKCLVKIALSLMPVEMVSYFSILRNFVLQGKDDYYIKCKLGEYVLDFRKFMKIKSTRVANIAPQRNCILHLKDESLSDELEVVFSLYVGDVILQAFIPSDRNLIGVIARGEDRASFHITPPEYITGVSAKFKSEYIDCTCHRIVIGEGVSKEFGHSGCYKLDEKVLKLDGNGGLTTDSLKEAIEKLVRHLADRR